MAFYTAMQRQVINQMLKLVSSDDKAKIVRAFRLAEKILNSLLRDSGKRKDLTDQTGMFAPVTVLMSPTMRCNLTCDGCYAAEYSTDQDLDRGLLQKIVDEGNDMGVYLFTMLGGEPFMYDGLLDCARHNQDAYFQVFTNGTLLDQSLVDELAEVGNVAPCSASRVRRR